MSSSSASKIKIASVDELFGLTAPADSISGTAEPGNGKDEWNIVYLNLDETHDFQGHPFRVLEDEKMMETVDSIKGHGVIVPGIARPRSQGGYEIIAGHRRRMASRLAGLTQMPFIVKDYTDAEATIIMVDSNIQRENLLPSEKAKAYKMRMDAEKQLKKEGKSEAGRSDSLLSRKLGESRNTIQRYIRLNYLLASLLDLVDTGKIKFTIGVEISYLHAQEQKWIWELYEEEGILPSLDEATRLKEHSKRGELNRAMVSLILHKDKPVPVKVTLAPKTIRSYFPDDYTKEQVEKVIFQLLDAWKEKCFG